MTHLIEGAHLADVLLLIAAVYFGWQRIVVPTWRAARWGVHEADDREVLKAIAAEFRPNSGRSLIDRIDAIDANQVEIRNEVAEVKNLVDVYLLSRQRGGRRHYDTDGTATGEDHWPDSDM